MKESMGKKLSVIIPVYKVEPYLRQCLDSVVNQTYKNLEIILVDDGSPDNCGAICDEYAQKDERIRVIHKRNEGLPAARNEGIRAATGEWLAFVDSDDWCELDYYEKLINAVEGYEADIFWAGGGLRECEHTCKKIVTSKQSFYYTEKKDIDHLMAQCLKFGPPWDKLFRVRFLRENKLVFDINDRANEDVWFNFITHDLAKCVGGCTVIGYHWRMVRTSITQGYNSEKPRICYRLIEKCSQYMNDRTPNEEVHNAILHRCITQLMSTFKCTWFHPANSKETAQINAEIKDALSWPHYAQAVHCKNNNGLNLKRRIIKYALRWQWIGILRMGYKVKTLVRG